MHNILLTYILSIHTSLRTSTIVTKVSSWIGFSLLSVSRRRSALVPHFRRGPLHRFLPAKARRGARHSVGASFNGQTRFLAQKHAIVGFKESCKANKKKPHMCRLT